MNDTVNRQILLVEKPTGKLGPEHFKLAKGTIPEPKDGEVLVRTRYISLDAANRAWMHGATYRAAVEANTAAWPRATRWTQRCTPCNTPALAIGKAKAVKVRAMKVQALSIGCRGVCTTLILNYKIKNKERELKLESVNRNI